MGLKTAGVGYFTIPTAPAAGTSITGGAANTFSTNYVQLIASTAAAIFVVGVLVQITSTSKPTYMSVRLATGGAGSETIVSELNLPLTYTAGATGTQAMSYIPLPFPIPVATTTRIAAKVADSVGSLAWLVTLQCINQSNVVDMGVNESGNVVQINGQTASASGTVTFPNATLASTTNITAGTITTVTTTTTATNLTNLPSIPSNWLTAAGINAGALNGKGDWLLSSSYTAPPSVASIATGVWQDTTAGDFTVASSIGKALYIANVAPGAAGGHFIAGSNAATTVNFTGNLSGSVGSVSGAVGSVTGAVASVTGNVGGNVVGSVGSVVGLTASNLDAAITSRAASATALTNATWTDARAGKLDNLDAAVTTRLASASYTAPDNADIAAIKVQTDKFVFTVANQVDANTRSINSATVNGDGTSGNTWGP